MNEEATARKMESALTAFLGLPRVEVDDYDDYGQEPVGYYALGQRFTGVVLE